MTPYQITLCLTVTIETGIVWMMARKERPEGETKQLVILAILVNLFTHPIATMTVRMEAMTWIQVELLVVLVEMMLYRFLSSADWKRAFWLSTISNLVTASLSFVL